jgi:hypothetical protein
MKARPVIRHQLVIPALFTVLLVSGCVSKGPVSADHWFRGNTHTHTVLCGHADSSPEIVTAWYHDHGYNFLILSEHNRFIDPDTVKLPENRRDDFILIPGVEVTGKKRIHSTAMNIPRVVPWKFDHVNKSAIIQNHVDGTIKAGGQPILNHPNGKCALVANDILPVNDLYMFELFNGHPGVRNDGFDGHPSTEDLWDKLLSEGMLVYGVSADDAHHFQKMGESDSNPGRGWVMVQASTLDPDAITKAMVQGDFYASNGVFLKTCSKGSDTYQIKVDARRTKQELTSLPALRGKYVDKGTEGYRIEFMGPNGDVLDTIKGKKGRFNINRSIPYVRAKVIFTRKHPQKSGLEEYYAWGQPVFTDARARIDTPGSSEHAHEGL